MSAIHMTYGSFNFEPQPIPLMNIQKNYVKTPNQINLGTTINVTLNGTIFRATGTESTILDTDDSIDAIRTAFNQDGLLFLVFCSGDSLAEGEEQFILNESGLFITSEDDTFLLTESPTQTLTFEDVSTVFFSGYPIIRSLKFDPSNDNWVRSVPYTIELEFSEMAPLEDSTLMPPYLKEASENWSIEPIDDTFSFSWLLSDGRTDSCPYKFRVTHEISAAGKAAYNGNGLIKQPWEWAKQFVTGLLGYDHSMVSQQGIVTFNPDLFGEFNHSRTHITDEEAGSFSVSESWLVIETGIGASGLPANAIENFSIEINKSINDGLTRGVVNGEIRGLNSISMTGTDIVVNEHAYIAASGYWKEIKNRLLQRVELVGDSTAVRPFNPLSVNNSVGHNIPNGLISYTYEYNDRPIVCTSNALQEVISISDNNPVDVFATLIVLGRLAGPVLQSIGTKTAPTRTLSIDIVLQPATGCPKNGQTSNWLSQKPNVSNIVMACESDLENNHDQVFKDNDQENWRAKIGSYSRTVTWKYLDCS